MKNETSPRVRGQSPIRPGVPGALLAAVVLHGSLLYWAAQTGLDTPRARATESTSFALTVAAPRPPPEPPAAPFEDAIFEDVVEVLEPLREDAASFEPTEAELVESEVWDEPPPGLAEPEADEPPPRLREVDLTPSYAFALGDLSPTSKPRDASAGRTLGVGPSAGTAPRGTSGGNGSGTTSSALAGAGTTANAAPAGVEGGTGTTSAKAVALETPAPLYPRLSQRGGEEGSVLCRLSISEQGTVTAVEVLESSGHARLDEAARTALLTWRFRPRREGGRALASTLDHRVIFRLESR